MFKFLFIIIRLKRANDKLDLDLIKPEQYDSIKTTLVKLSCCLQNHEFSILKQTTSTELVCFAYYGRFNNNLFLPLYQSI